MNDNLPKEDELSDEFRNLGKNLLGVLQAAWDHPERKRMQVEIENGLRELGSSLQHEAEKFSNSPAGEKMKAEMDGFGERIRSGEAQTRIYDDILSALKAANSELSKVMLRIVEDKPENPSPTSDESQNSNQ